MTERVYSEGVPKNYDTSPDFDHVRDELTAAGYHPTSAAHALYLAAGILTLAGTVRYYAERGWDAVRVNGSDRHAADSISFARFSDEGAYLMTTTISGSISTQANFSTDRHGLRMFTVAAELLP